MSRSSASADGRPYSQRVPVGDSGLAYVYEGVARGDRLEITSVTIQLPEGMSPGAAPTLRKVGALLAALPASARTLTGDSQSLMDEIQRRAGLTEFLTEREPLQRPTSGLTDAFLADLAAAYRDHSLRTHKPNVAIANECGAKVTTVRSWVLEARRRGFLPKAEKGRAT